MGQEKPKVLYRGVTISYDLLKDFHFDGYPLVPPNEPKIDAQGRKTVGDGNEYGVYMTDNFAMADYAYGNLMINLRKSSHINLLLHLSPVKIQSIQALAALLKLLVCIFL